jgi:hypothetical protein
MKLLWFMFLSKVQIFYQNYLTIYVILYFNPYTKMFHSNFWFIFINYTRNDLHINYSNIYCYINRLGGVMVSVLALSVVDRGFEHLSVKTKY